LSEVWLLNFLRSPIGAKKRGFVSHGWSPSHHGFQFSNGLMTGSFGGSPMTKTPISEKRITSTRLEHTKSIHKHGVTIRLKHVLLSGLEHISQNIIWLVVYLTLWKIWKSAGMIIPNIWKNNKCSKPPTST
jgi:hypothetical protein